MAGCKRRVHLHAGLGRLRLRCSLSSWSGGLLEVVIAYGTGVRGTFRRSPAGPPGCRPDEGFLQRWIRGTDGAPVAPDCLDPSVCARLAEGRGAGTRVLWAGVWV